MIKKIAFGAALLAVVAGLAPSASASCLPAKSAGTYNTGALTYTYWHSPTGNTGTLIGQFWQVGNSTASNTGNCPTTFPGKGGLGTVGLYFGGPGIGLSLDLGACGNGCVANTMGYLAQKKTSDGTQGEFLYATVAETPNGGLNFDYSVTPANPNLVVIPRPRVTGSSRAGTNVNLNITVDPVSAGVFGSAAPGSVTGYRILSKSSPGDPGRDASSYDTTPLASLAGPGGATASGAVVVDCSNTAQDRWVVTQLSFEGGLQFSNVVSGATRVGCNPLLADPHFKIIPKTPANKTNKPLINPNN